MNYAEEKARIENEIKELTAKLENLKKQEEKEEKKNEWKKTLFGRFKEFIENIDFSEIDQIYIEARSDGYGKKFQNNFFSSFLENTAKVETEPKAEPTKEPEPEPTAEEKNEPENKFKIGDYVFYRNCNVYGEIIEIKGGIISIKEKDGNIYKVRPEWIYEVEKPAEIYQKLTETPEEKPVKMKMSLDELIKGME